MLSAPVCPILSQPEDLMKKKARSKEPAPVEKRTLTANDLRWLGEGADGDRDKDCVVAWVGNELKVVEKKSSGPDEPLVLHVRTPSRGPGMRGGLKVSITFEKDEPIPLDSTIDAIFLTQSAVEKFVLPYYMRMQDPEWIAETRDALYRKDIVATLHASPSSSGGIPRKPLKPMLRDPKTGEVTLLDAI